LDQSREWLREKAAQHRHLVFCVGENGLDLAVKLGMNPDCRVKTANWLGPLLVEAGQLGVEGVLLLGYHGKLIKLAGGIFHTHHHVADGRQEIFQADTVEAGLRILQDYDAALATQVYQGLAERIDDRAAAYVNAHTGQGLRVGSLLFNRQRQIVATSTIGQALFQQVLLD
jgi:cobalt-precorrin-5B (C1)-methyltransferase